MVYCIEKSNEMYEDSRIHSGMRNGKAKEKDPAMPEFLNTGRTNKQRK